MPIEVEQRILALRKLIARYDYEYYVLDTPTVPDSEYDTVYRELQALENQYPDLITPDSPIKWIIDEKFNYSRINILIYNFTNNKNCLKWTNQWFCQICLNWTGKTNKFTIMIINTTIKTDNSANLNTKEI